MGSKKQKEKMYNYREMHKISELKVGDNVKVLRKFSFGKFGYNLNWVTAMDKYIGNTHEIIGSNECRGFLLEATNSEVEDYYYYYFPCFVLEKVEDLTKEKSPPLAFPPLFTPLAFNEKDDEARTTDKELVNLIKLDICLTDFIFDSGKLEVSNALFYLLRKHNMESYLKSSFDYFKFED